ncbi:uncharacterized protein JCM6883_002854 [Sporobolomyces salmoneus]|uniref:uncharacterized protein n=1 Tax=Sporobolomyces salmoneus TaxID=183962 RepID=UPI0031787613
MLSSLPPELLRDIIESSVPRTYHSTSYDDRQATLRSRSLVSRQFREIAQPLLFEVVHIVSDPQLNLLASAENKTLRLKELILETYPEVKPTEKLLGRCTSLESLVIARYNPDGGFDLGVLADYTNFWICLSLHHFTSIHFSSISHPHRQSVKLGSSTYAESGESPVATGSRTTNIRFLPVPRN